MDGRTNAVVSLGGAVEFNPSIQLQYQASPAGNTNYSKTFSTVAGRVYTVMVETGLGTGPTITCNNSETLRDTIVQPYVSGQTYFNAGFAFKVVKATSTSMTVTAKWAAAGSGMVFILA